MMGREDAQNMYSFIIQQIWINGASVWLFKKKSITMHGNMKVNFHYLLKGLVISQF